ncbi:MULTISPECIES: ABC transporter [Streptococcus]|uniref:ABC transporter n=1 Tax=Streptococcus iners TaxID=3028084 RepID=A0AA96VIR7_9STRE|nr:MULTISPECIES: ABC transporter [Streptococcus]MCK3904348.1 ABC transporter [Streptococcus suis]MCK4025491.1 ABC transporter [Streptococcus suis]WNY50156.1 ABC transporter [Streptococcus sp. 29887]
MIEEVIDAINGLIYLIEKFKINGLQVQVDYLKHLEQELIENSVPNLTKRQRMTIYNQLFPPRGGLSDINYWTNDFESRKQINEQLNTLKTVISDYLLLD